MFIVNVTNRVLYYVQTDLNWNFQCFSFKLYVHLAVLL